MTTVSRLSTIRAMMAEPDERSVGRYLLLSTAQTLPLSSLRSLDSRASRDQVSSDAGSSMIFNTSKRQGSLLCSTIL